MASKDDPASDGNARASVQPLSPMAIVNWTSTASPEIWKVPDVTDALTTPTIVLGATGPMTRTSCRDGSGVAVAPVRTRVPPVNRDSNNGVTAFVPSDVPATRSFPDIGVRSATS
jgi:hypothetical protein